MGRGIKRGSKDRQAIWKDGGYKKKRHKEDIIYTDFGTCGAKPT